MDLSAAQTLLAAGHIDDAARALAAAPDDPGAVRLLARIRLHQGRANEALALLVGLLDAVGPLAGLAFELGVVCLALGEAGEAVRYFEAELARDADHADAAFNLAWALRRLGRGAEAEAPLRRALAGRPDWAAGWFNLGNLLADELGRPAEAVAAFDSALARGGATPDILNNLGMALWRAGRVEEAEFRLRGALAADPAMVGAAANLGDLLCAQGRGAEALDLLRVAVLANPEEPGLRLNLGLVLLGQRRIGEAEAELARAVVLAPGRAEAHNALGSALLAMEEVEAAEAAFLKALELRPDFADACNNLGNLESGRARPAEALDYFRRAHAMAPEDARIHSNLLFFLTHMGALDRSEVVAEHRRYGQLQERVAPLPLPPPEPNPARLRIGYVSPDFCDHAAAMWVEPILERHDRSRFEVFCYTSGPRHDHVSRRIQGYDLTWRSIAALDPDSAARLIRDDGIHVLVDLAGHSAHNALPVFARKPAPIQAAMIGYPFTTGLSRIDYRVAARHFEPDDQSAQEYTETLEWLDQAPVLRPPAEAPEPGASPAASGGPIRFGSFNKPQKIVGEVVGRWAEILAGCPGSTLLMVVPGGDDAATRGRYGALFEAHGVAASRIETAGTCPLYPFLELVRSVDIALDPFPYAGGTTSILTLWMGVPVATMFGIGAADGVATGMLAAVGLDDLIARSTEGYVGATLALAADRERLARLRGELRARVAASFVRQEAALVAELEAAYGRWWARTVGNGGG